MKKSVAFLMMVLGIVACNANAKNCKKAATNISMSYYEAKTIATSSECGVNARLLSKRWCNEGTGTWWIALKPYQPNPGCHPACVVDVVTKTAVINWMCTGLSQSSGKLGTK
jgi:hypothetical protein